jgi:GntR family transcriptional regulator, transcriptional repressor for pyruvate dehydrogenase complex
VLSVLPRLPELSDGETSEVSTLKVTDSAIERIRTMIAEGSLGPGDRLPPEHELAEHLGVSRGSLREAVRALSQINVLSVRRGDGTYVTALEPRELLAGMAFAIDLLQGRKLDEILEVRRLLLPQAVGLAAERVTPEQLDRMRDVVLALEGATDPDVVAELHVEFHAIISEATANEALTSILDALQLRADHVRRWWLTSYSEVALAHQRLLLGAFERRDADMARSVALIQVDERQRWLDKVRYEKEPGVLARRGET